MNCLKCDDQLLDADGRLLPNLSCEMTLDKRWYVLCPKCQTKNALRQCLQPGPTVYTIDGVIS